MLKPAVVLTGLLGVASLLSGCGSRSTVQASNTPSPASIDPARSREVRATGTIQAVRAHSIQVPQITGQSGRLTLVKLVPNGTPVKEGDMLAEFDRTQQVDAARDAQAKFEDLGHQVKQKEAQNRSESEKRSSDIKQAQADLDKAEIQLKKGPVLSEIDRLKNEEKAASARKRVESLTKIDQFKTGAEASALKILELQRDRQKVALERSQRNYDRLLLKAPISGMVSLDTIWRGGSMGNAQEGDQLFNGQPLLKIFDPNEMEVHTLIGEPDGAVLKPGVSATVYLDAYPDAKFQARFHSSSPVATTALGSPIKNFTARFRLEATDRRLLPDLSAAVVVARGNDQP